MFSNAHAVAMLYSVTDNFKLKLGGFLNTEMHSSVTLLSAQYQMNDTWRLETQYLNISGNTDSFLGLYENNDALGFKLVAQF